MTKNEVACTRVHYQPLLESLRGYWHCCVKLCGDFGMVVYAHHGTLQVGVQEIVLAYSNREHVFYCVVVVKGTCRRMVVRANHGFRHVHNDHTNLGVRAQGGPQLCRRLQEYWVKK